MYVTFEDWTQHRKVSSLGTNHGAPVLPFQGWRNFKEAFTPEVIELAVRESDIEVSTCLDPFGGSGTTALACQFLGIHPITVEVNPYLADLIEAKISSYDVDRLVKDHGQIVRFISSAAPDPDDAFAGAPKTLIEPGFKGRYIFSRPIASRILAYRQAIDTLENTAHRRLFRILLGSIIIPLSNIVVKGKGRRYRSNWRTLNFHPEALDREFASKISTVIGDICRYSSRACTSYEIFRGDSRELLNDVKSFDLSVFSPPYPNSFDYTDVYNVELWTLGYLDGRDANSELRNSTLCSHVQIQRTYPLAPKESLLLEDTLNNLDTVRSQLWNRNIPEMIGGYFADMSVVLKGIRQKIREGGKVFMVVGDSRYAGIKIPSTTIISQLAPHLGFFTESTRPFRSMRSSAQQGGNRVLAENLIVLKATD